MRLPATLASAAILIPFMVSGAVVVVSDDSAGFPLVDAGVAAPIIVPGRVPQVVRIAAEDLADDVERVTGVRPEILERRPGSGQPAVVLRLAADAKDHWETFRLSATSDTLVIDGTDPRGLAYGVYELSKRIGVSPWYWWADVPVKQREALHLSLGTDSVASPSVKYRGIFINDEGWGLRPWAAKTHEPEVGNIGPKTYRRVFELLLRLRANTIWPAMHPGTTPFHQMPGNAKAADDYAIVVGSSHAEPMLRNNVGEWTKPHHEYNFLAHRDTVMGYWEERIRERTSGESIFTLGMRGIHDSAIVGPKNQRERIRTLETIFEEQRRLLERQLGGRGKSRYSQMFCPYKEVLDDYLAGLKVPEDVTLLWPDDNFGYVRRFATEEERKRPGGLGVYYHLSYLGAPFSWLWFGTLPPALIWAEMTRAYEQGAGTLWIGNVGDIKGNELSTEYFLNLAWNAGHATPDHANVFLTEMAARDFGDGKAAAIASLWDRHLALAFARKPEHLQWNLPGRSYRPTEFNEREIKGRLEEYASLVRDCEAIASELPGKASDAYFQLVGYHIWAAAAANQHYFYAELARLQKARGESEAARETFEASKQGERRMAELTRRYNEETSGGKWRDIVIVNGIPKSAWTQYQPGSLPALDSDAQKSVRAAESPPTVGGPPSIPAGTRPGDFIERGGVVSIHAGHFTGRQDLRDGAGWRSVPGLGRSGSAVTVLPSTATISDRAAPRLSYRFHVTTGGETTVRVRLLPTHPLETGRGLRFALAIDRGMPLPLAVTDGFDTHRDEWKYRVLSNSTETTLKLPSPLLPGWHTLHLVAVDAGVVVDKIVIDLGGLRPSYDGPPETRID